MKYLLDTCVVSELIKPTPDESVVEWFSQIPDEDLYLSSVAIGEIARGLEALPSSRRRRTYEKWFHESVEIAYAGRILAYDATAAKRWATIMATAAAKGHPRPAIDAMVAAIASVHGMAVATCNVSHLKYTGVPVVNPFEFKKGTRTSLV